jgi:tRNA pseudouridine55 synthase
VLLVDKPEGVSSAGVVRGLKRHVGRRSKIGHVGTLDPFASGLLPLCVGEATKIAGYLVADEKEYEGTIQLGTETDTLDPTGRVVEVAVTPDVSQAQLNTVAAAFVGVVEQRPPMYSAIKQEGVPLYRLARRGVEVERPVRQIRIGSLVLTRVGSDRVELSVRCSKGTYVRVLAADVAHRLGTVGHLARLRRVAVGGFRVEQAVAFETLRAGPWGDDLPLVTVADANRRHWDGSSQELRGRWPWCSTITGTRSA